MEISNKYYKIVLGEDQVLRFIPGSSDLPDGVFPVTKEELDQYIGTLQSVREYLYD